MQVVERVDAKKERHGPEDALALARRAHRVLIARGKKLLEFDTARADDEELLAGMIGPSGNLRAPTIRVGKTLLVGYHEEAYERVFG